MKERNLGMAAAIGCYVLWGILPIYWKQLEGAAGAYEILAHRMIWSFVFMTFVLYGGKLFPKFRATVQELWENKGKGLLMLAASALITVNWLIFIWAVNHDRIVESSFGYYINPLFSVMLGIVFFGERLSAGKWAAMAVAFAGISYMTWQMGQLPLIAVGLALSFGLYGAAKKQLCLNPFISLTLETLLALPVAFWFALMPMEGMTPQFGNGNVSVMALLMGAGVVTALPLLLFSMGANRLPLNVLGFCQYLSPSLSLAVAVFLYGEPFTAVEGISFSFIWAALVLFTAADWVENRRKD